MATDNGRDADHSEEFEAASTNDTESSLNPSSPVDKANSDVAVDDIKADGKNVGMSEGTEVKTDVELGAEEADPYVNTKGSAQEDDEDDDVDAPNGSGPEELGEDALGDEKNEEAGEEAGNSPKKLDGKKIGIAVAIGGAALVAILCLVFLVVIPFQQQAAYEAAQTAMSQYDFEGAIANLQNAGDSDDVDKLMDTAERAKKYKDRVVDAFDNVGVNDQNHSLVSDAVDWLMQVYPEYPDIESYRAYLDAYDSAGSKNLFDAYSQYTELGDFYDARDKADEINTQMEQLYNEGNTALSNKDWKAAEKAYEQINGYKDTSEKLSQVENEAGKIDLANKLKNILWMRKYLMTVNGSYYFYALVFRPYDNNNPLEGEAIIMLQANNAQAGVARYTYSVISKDTIHMNGQYNTGGNPPVHDFNADVEVTFTNSSKDSYTTLELTGQCIKLNPEPVEGVFRDSAWMNMGAFTEPLPSFNV